MVKKFNIDQHMENMRRILDQPASVARPDVVSSLLDRAGARRTQTPLPRPPRQPRLPKV